jgi:hypothetical protein
MIEISCESVDYTNLTVRNLEALEAASKNRSGAINNVSSSDEATMSFEDFLDMINPLEHIPVISSIYRAIVGENINPVSRIAGDALYGGVFGLASAGLSAAGAIADEVFAANNDGQSASEIVVAALFGDDRAEKVQVAQAPTDAETKKVAGTQTPDPVGMQTAAVTSPAAADTLTTPFQVASKGFPLDKSKLPFGGVMDSGALANAKQNQTLALAMTGRREAQQAQRALHNSRFAVATPTPPPSPGATESAPTVEVEPETQVAMQKLLQELQAMKGINQYKNAAQNTPLAGENVNILD